MAPTRLVSQDNVPAPGDPPTPAELAIVSFMIVVALYFAQVVLVPLALAVILSFILAPAVRAFKRVGIPNTPSVILVVAFAFAIIFGIGALITQQVATLAQDLPRYQITLKEKVASLRDATSGSGGALQRAGDTLKELQKQLEAPNPATSPPATVTIGPLQGPLGGTAAGNNGRPIPVEVHTPTPTALDQLQDIIGVILHPLATTGAVLLFTLFLLLQREDVRDRAIRLFGSHDLEKSTTAMDDAGHRLSQYFLGMTAINSAFGVVIGLGLWAIGVPSPILWGVLAMLMRFVPFIGAFIAAGFPLLLAAAVDPGWTMFLWTLALYLVAEPLMGSVIEPVVQGNRTGLSPLAIIISAAFWTLLWGPIGLLLAVPLTVVLVVLGRHIERLEFLNVLLGDTPPLSPAQHFYQRMLAGDPAEAVEQAEQFASERPLVDYYDEVVVDGLRLAQADADRGALDAARLESIRDTAEVVIDALADQEFVPRYPQRKPLIGGDTTDADASADEGTEDDGKDLPKPGELMLGEGWKAPNAVLCVPGRTPLDETVAIALANLLSRYGIGARVLATERLRHGAISAEDREGTLLICVSSLDTRERSAHARFLVRRLQRSAPGCPILGGFWGMDADTQSDASIIGSIPVDNTATSLRQALRFCIDTANEESSLARAAAVETMRHESGDADEEVEVSAAT